MHDLASIRCCMLGASLLQAHAESLRTLERLAFLPTCDNLYDNEWVQVRLRHEIDLNDNGPGRIDPLMSLNVSNDRPKQSSVMVQLGLPNVSFACPFSAPPPLLTPPLPGGLPRPLVGLEVVGVVRPLLCAMGGGTGGLRSSCLISFDKSRAKW
jgi:hypothetical protein